MDWFSLSLVLVVVALLIAIGGLDYPLLKIWSFQRKRVLHRAEQGRSRIMVRLGRPERYHVDLREIRDLVVSLELGTSMDQTLSGALSQAAQQFKHRGIFGERLEKQVEARLSIAPEEVLKGLADDFQSEHLKNLPERLETARNGGFAYERALSLTASQVEEEIRGNLRREIQQMPIRLTFPMIGGVFLAALALGLYPLLLNLLTTSVGFR
jgi:hypothetical protein